MNFTEIQTLTEITSLKVAVAVCNQFEICFTDSIFHWEYGDWNFILCNECSNKIKEMVSHLQLPRDLENKVHALCRHVYHEMCIWSNSLEEIHSMLMPGDGLTCSCLDQVDFRRYYEWRSIGIIEEKKTVENIIRDQRLDLHFRFVMACYFCFETDVRSLWDIMPQESKRNIRDYTCTSLPLVSVWLRRLDGKIMYGASKAFESFLGDHYMVYERFLSNVSLLQYFLQVIPYGLRKKRLNFVARRIVRCHQVMRFCLFNMNDEEQEIIFQTNPHAVLCSFLDWPWQRHFMKLAFVTFNFLKESDYFSVMLALWRKHQWRDYDYIKLLTEFWNHSPTHLKEYVRRNEKAFMERLINCLKENYNFHDFH